MYEVFITEDIDSLSTFIVDSYDEAMVLEASADAAGFECHIRDNTE
jgi:hypothetical protein